jgi:hypothetical protein
MMARRFAVHPSAICVSLLSVARRDDRGRLSQGAFMTDPDRERWHQLIEPCLRGIKHDGYRILAPRDAKSVRHPTAPAVKRDETKGASGAILIGYPQRVAQD